MKRREFITLFGSAAAAWPLAARAQEPDRIYRLGVLHQLPRPAAQFARLFDGLRRQGFIEGQNLSVDPGGFGSSTQQYQERGAEMGSKLWLPVIISSSGSHSLLPIRCQRH